MPWQPSQPIYVTVARDPAELESPGTTVMNIIVGSLGLAGAMLVASILLGGLVAYLLIRWHQRHPPESDHLPPVSPLVADSESRPSSPAR